VSDDSEESQMINQMSVDELLALPVTVDLATAGKCFGIGRTRAHELARDGEFPVRVLRVGLKYRVPRTAIFEALGIDPATALGVPDGQAAAVG
jgi:hypothetical protein